ncbi:toxin-antitoxin system YwqK family antitoxin [Gynurincola endophyticus]|uniref:toxin-antitoxin system YwqK family antitoxin n=1 Tax=Gynurincola endophyticus TaxID=2479004 RepID=UPI000F8D2EF8|nr:toxin-antitoxin system YwqK family antitoxin [Gynurincola endophyticus]
MKIQRLFILAILVLCSFSASAQSDSPINWFWENFIKHIKYPPDIYSDVRMKSVTACEIELSYLEDGEPESIIFSSKYIYLDEYGIIKKKENYQSIRTIRHKKNDFTGIHAFSIQKESIPLIKQKLIELTSQCNDTYDYWKTKDQAIDWLKLKLNMYFYTRSTLNDKYVSNPRIEKINECEILLNYDITGNGGNRWAEPKKVGVAKETIPMNMERISSVLYNFQNESAKIEQFDGYLNKTQSNQNSIIKIAYAEENLYERILKAMKFLHQSCVSDDVFEEMAKTGRSFVEEEKTPPPTKESIVKYDDGTIKQRGFFTTNNKATGEWKFYHHNGELHAIGNFEEHQKTGLWKYYYDTGNLLETGLYSNNERQGEWKSYNDYNKKLSSQGFYKNGKKVGLWKEFNIDGSTASIGSYDANGLKNGLWKEYHENGKMKEECEYLSGNRIGAYKSYHENGKVWVIGQYDINGDRVGEWKAYYDDGKLESKNQYVNGKVQRN